MGDTAKSQNSGRPSPASDRNHPQSAIDNSPSILVSVVIPAYNEEKLIAAAIESVWRSASPLVGQGRVEVIVVDNASTDRTAEVATQARARVVTEPRRQIARARNVGARNARGEFLIFLDADSQMHPDQLQRAVELLASGHVIGGGALIAMDAAWDYRAFVGVWNFVSRICRLAAGSFLFCARESFERVGGFDETLYASEELAFSKALKRLGGPQGKRFVILADLPVKTSNRKVVDHTRWQNWSMLLRLAVKGEKGLRDPAACAFWYPETRK